MVKDGERVCGADGAGRVIPSDVTFYSKYGGLQREVLGEVAVRQATCLFKFRMEGEDPAGERGDSGIVALELLTVGEARW